MGGHWSSLDREPSPDPWWPTQQLQVPPVFETTVEGKEIATESTGTCQRGTVKTDELEEFKQELKRKRALRHEAIAAVQAEMKDLRQRVEQEISLRKQAEQERDRLKTVLYEQEGIKKEEIIEVTELQKKEDIMSQEQFKIELEKEREEKRKLVEERDLLLTGVEDKAGLQRQVQALKDVSEIGKEMLRIRELQVKELKKKLVEINISSVMAPPEDLRVEYEKQIENIRKLRTLYEERAAATLLEHRRELEREEARIVVLETKLSELQKEMDEVKETKKELEGKIDTLENTLKHKENELEITKDNLFSSTVQNKSLSSQMTLINNLFSHMLISPEVDLDRLIRLLKENHGLITDLTLKGDSNEVAALLVDLADQVDKEKIKEYNEEDKKEINENVEAEISENLTKVWRVMVELLSHHQNTTHTELAGGADSCYKCIQTPSGPRSVISVSQTFLTLKDLILEKNQLVKEVSRLKTLNNHLEHRLGSQEKRLSVVTTELRKTWGVVNKLKAQHKQLHTHEKILRYELQQKRCMLTELKQELECCRDKWERAREKNSQTEEDWKKLRIEFASRKCRKESNSAESGYEEEDVAHSSPTEADKIKELSKLRQLEINEQENSEDEIEHSDGNSFDTVIDILDIAYIENQSENESGSSFMPEVSSEVTVIPSSLLPLTGSEFTEGLDQIESEDLAAVLDPQYQNQLLGADYNLSLPSSSGSSPIPTENDDFTSSEMDISEENSSPNHNSFSSYTSVFPSNKQVSESSLSISPTSSSNISKFLDGLLVESNHERATSITNKNTSLSFSTQEIDENDCATPLVVEENCASSTTTPTVNNNNFEFPDTNTHNVSTEEKGCKRKTGVKTSPKPILSPPTACSEKSVNRVKMYEEKMADNFPGTSSQEDILKAREDRLKKLEAQCRSLVNKVSSSTFRSEVISNLHDELHMCHDSSEETLSGTNPNLTKHPPHCELKEREQNSFTYGLDFNSLPKAQTNPSSETASVFPIGEELNSSKTIVSSPQNRSPEQILEARAARLKRLEDQCRSLFSKMSATSSRSDVISNKLDEIHNSYVASDHKADQKLSNECCPRQNLLCLESSKDQEINHQPKSSTTTLGEVTACKSFDISSESKKVLNRCCLPGPSEAVNETLSAVNYENRTPEQILEARAERFKRLEEQCKSLVSKMTATSLRSEIISNKLDELHSCYGSSEDACDGEDLSFSKNENRQKPTPTSSPRNSRKIAQFAEKDKEPDVAVAPRSEEERGLPHQETNVILEESVCTNSPSVSDPKTANDDTLQTNMLRPKHSKEQLSEVSTTSQQSDPTVGGAEESHNKNEQSSDQNHSQTF